MPRSDLGGMRSSGYDKDDWITRELTAFLSSNGSIYQEDEAELAVPIQGAEQHVKQAWQQQQGLGSTDTTPFDSLSAWLASNDGFRTTADGLLLLKALHTQPSLDANAAAAVPYSATPTVSVAPHPHPHTADADHAPPTQAHTQGESLPQAQEAQPNTEAAATGGDDADGVPKPTPVAKASTAAAEEEDAAPQHRDGPDHSGSDGGDGAGIAQRHEPPEPEVVLGTASPADEGDQEYADALEADPDGADGGGGGSFPAGGADVSALLGWAGEEEGEEGGSGGGDGDGDGGDYGGGVGGDEGDYGEIAPSSGAWVASEGEVADAGAGGAVGGAGAGDAAVTAAAKPGGAAAPATSAPPARPSASASPSITTGLATLLAVAFPGSDPVTVLRRALVEIMRERPSQRLVTFAELGVRLPNHQVAGPLWRSPGLHLPRLKDVVDGASSAAPGVFLVERHESGTQLLLSVDVGALRVVALRRAVSAAFPGGDDASAVRRAAAAALIDADATNPIGRASLNMPAMGQAVIRAANEPRQRLALSRGEAFSLGAVLTERRPGPGGQSYMVVEPSPSGVGGLRYARLDMERLLQDAASGRLGDLTGVPLVPLGLRPAVSSEAVSVTAASREASAPVSNYGASAAPAPKPGSRSGTAMPPRVKEALRAAIPDDRPSMSAKRALALVAAASLGGSTAGAFHSSDPPYSIRSSPAGLILQELGLKPPKGQMRALFDEEPRIFEAGKPSCNYLIQLVHPELRELAAQWPGEVAAAVERQLRGRTFVGLNLRKPPASADDDEGAAASSTAKASAAASAAPYGTRAPAAATAAAGTRSLGPSHPAPPPPGQPDDYYARLERALEERLSNNSASEFIMQARRVLAGVLLQRTYRFRGPLSPPPHAMSVKDAAALLKREFPQAYTERRPPGVFPINVVMLAQQLSLLFILDKGSGNHPSEWTVRLNINSLELSAGLNPTPPQAPAASSAVLHEPGNDAGWGTSESEDTNAYVDGYHQATEANAAVGTEPATDAAGEAADLMPAAVVADILATQPARALAAALAPTVPPDLLPDPEVHIITVPYSITHVTALAHCLSCPQIGLAAKSVGGMPAMAMLYAPAVDSLKPAATAAAGGGGGAKPPSPAGVLPATVYVFDAVAAGPTEGVVLLASLRTLLEEPGVAKVVYGCEQLVPGLEQAVGCCVSPLLDTRVVSEMLKPLDLSGAAAGSGSAGDEEAPTSPDEGSAPQLWHLPSNWQACLTTKFRDYNMAVFQHASGTDSSWLTRPLDSSQMGLLVRAVQHLPELWSALTWLLPRLAQFCSVVRAQQCRALLAPQSSW